MFGVSPPKLWQGLSTTEHGAETPVYWVAIIKFGASDFWEFPAMSLGYMVEIPQNRNVHYLKINVSGVS